MRGEIRNNISRNLEKPECTHRRLRKRSVGFFLSIGIVIVLVPSGWSKTIHVPGDSGTIQAGINGAIHGDTVLVADGVYTGEGNKNIDFLGKAIVVHSENGPEVTVIDCEDEGRGFYFHNGEGSNSKLEGLTIRHGYATGAEGEGGGIRMNDSSPTIADCFIQENNALWDGGGVYLTRASPAIINCTISRNKAVWRSGGGIYSAYYSFPIIFNCTISDNQAGESWEPDLGDGGGIYSESATIINCEILENRAAYNGGGISCRSSSIINCLISGNSAFWWEGSVGGGIYCVSSTITNCIIKGNDADAGPGGGIFCWGSTTIINSIILKNKPGYSPGQGWEGAGIYCGYSSAPIITNSIVRENHGYEISGEPVVSYSDIEGGFPGEGNIDGDPLFRNPENGDYHLMATYCGDSLDSPCIDAGDQNVLDDSLDCWHGLGTSRSDMGAYGGDNSGWPTAVEEEESEVGSVPKDFMLVQNYPNPFNEATTLRFRLTKKETVRLIVYNVLGQQLKVLVEGQREAGEHSVVWDAFGLSSGIYFARLEVGGYSRTIKMVLLK